MGAYFLDEPLNMWVGVGTVFVLLGVFWASKIKRVY